MDSVWTISSPLSRYGDVWTGSSMNDDIYERYHRELEDLRLDWEMENVDWEEEDHWMMVLNDPRAEW